ncbi:MAG TPA: hypothetical protein VGQ71_03880 [Terriglobales bacterium]|jgi:multidrug efflux pump subunit AcrA (membrane-fusion protein)|nr:hypothetical protein [Terriglobales bacterium]
MEGDSEKQRGGLRYVLLAIAAVYVVGSLYLLIDTRGRVDKIERNAALAQEKLNARLADTQASLKAADEALASKVGMTETQLARRTAELQRQQRAAEIRLAEQRQELGEMTGQVAGVRTEVGAVKSDVGTVKTELETTKLKLERAIGDLGVQSGLIARTRDDLDYLKHRGDRNYYEFTLSKGNRAVAVHNISLQLKKTDAKKGKFTLNVIADDRTVEKKDRTVYEPLQFYTGRDRQMYELVVFNVDKDKVAGYLSTPKALAPPQAQ